MPPVKNRAEMTSYGGIIRIRLKGRSSITSSQPAITSSPVYLRSQSITNIWLCQSCLPLLLRKYFHETIPSSHHLDWSNILKLDI